MLFAVLRGRGRATRDPHLGKRGRVRRQREGTVWAGDFTVVSVGRKA